MSVGLIPMLLPTFLGAIVGLMLALSGAGGGIIAVPLLVFVLGISIQQAAPIGLLAVGLSAAIGATLAFRQGQLRYRAASLIGLFGILAAPLGVFIAHQLPSEPLMLGFALILIGLASKTLLKSRDRHANPRIPAQAKTCQINTSSGRFIWNKPCAVTLSATGIVSGFLSGLLGVGGGFVIVPALNRYSDLPTHSAISTALGVIALVALSGVTAAAAHGAVNLVITIPFATGAIAGMLLGKRIAANTHSRLLQRNFALICLLAAGLLILQASGIFSFRT